MKLDYGCGAGGFDDSPEHHPRDRGSWLIRNGGCDTYAIDIDSKAIEKAKSRIHNGTTFQIADGRHLPYNDNCFDIVHEHGVFHHISKYTDAITEIARVIKTGGELHLFETVDNYPPYALARRIINSWEGCKVVSYYKSDELINELKRYFNISKVVYHWHPLIFNLIFLKKRYSGWVACMYFRYYVSKVLNTIGLGKAMCCHITIIAIKKGR